MKTEETIVKLYNLRIKKRKSHCQQKVTDKEYKLLAYFPMPLYMPNL